MALRILEIGHLSFIKEAFPEQTDRVDTSFSQLPGQGQMAKLRAVGRQFALLCRAAFVQRYEVIFCRCFGRFIYRRDVPLPVNVLRWLMSGFIKLCVGVQTARGARLAVIDHLDEATIDARDLFLLRRCRWYFKRELPQNAWNTFLRVQPRHGEFCDLVNHPDFSPYLGRFAPLSLGMDAARRQRIEDAIHQMPDSEKQIDVFYAGLVKHSSVRMAGWSQLEELRRRGYRIEAIEGYLPYAEFVEKMRRSWLVWSPEGQGWDCYRHYEVCVAGSVPLINHAGILRYQPLLPGVHCIEYAVEGDDLCRQVERALADKTGLEQIAAAAREHVLKFHTNEKLGEYMVRHVLAVAPTDTRLQRDEKSADLATATAR